MNITFHECRYILHLKDYDSGVFFYREVLGLQPNYNWSIVPDQTAGDHPDPLYPPAGTQ